MKVRSKFILPFIFILLQFSYAKSQTLTLRLSASRDSENFQSNRSESDLKVHAQFFSTLDTNFRADGTQRWSGVPLQRLAELAGEGPFRTQETVTFVANNSYICASTFEFFRDVGAFLATSVQGKAIAPNRGGPWKLMFQKEQLPGAYCWYVTQIYFGEPSSPSVKVRAGNTQKTFTIPQLEALPHLTQTRLLPVPRGYRFQVATPKEEEKISSISLISLVKKLNIPFSSVVLRSILGQEISLSAQELTSDVLIVFKQNEKPLPVHCGGPFSVVFPKGGALEEKWKALFFLEEVLVLSSETGK